MNLKKHFAADSPREVNGIKIWITDTLWVRIARFGNPKYQEKVKSLRRKKYKHHLQMGLFTDAMQERMLKEGLVATVLVDWDGVTNDDGSPCAFSEEAALDALSVDNFYQQVLMISQDRATFESEEEEIWLNDVLREVEERDVTPVEDQEAKNLLPSSSGSLSTANTSTSSE